MNSARDHVFIRDGEKVRRFLPENWCTPSKTSLIRRTLEYPLPLDIHNTRDKLPSGASTQYLGCECAPIVT
jgi:hypothetical protein